LSENSQKGVIILGAATIQAQIGTGASVSWANAEGGVKFNLEDTISGTTPIAIPTATGTNFSWIKNLVLAVTVVGTTAITNRTIKQASTPSTGLALFWKDVAVASYAQAASGNRPTASGSNGATPAGYAALTGSAVQYDNTSHVTSGTGPNGDMAVCVLGVDNTTATGPGNAIALPNIVISYDEA
jgi:hypothetical protein